MPDLVSDTFQSPAPAPSQATTVLVPQPVFDELLPLVQTVPSVRLLPYDENPDVPVPPGAENADAVFRWVAGKRYESLILNASARWLHTASAGVDHVLTPALKARENFTLTDSGPAFGICIGEFVLMWMLAVAHRLPDLMEQQEQKKWQWLTQKELHGQTVGIIGLGPIGQGIAERCKAFGMKTIGFRRTDAPVPQVDTVLVGADGLRFLLEQSDWVVVAAASTEKSQKLLGAGQFALMKPSAHLINIARGALLDETALIDTLRQNRIAGACLDVFETEPLPKESPLWEMPNVLIAPHNSPGWTSGLRKRQIDLFVENLARFASGEALHSVVNVERGY